MTVPRPEDEFNPAEQGSVEPPLVDLPEENDDTLDGELPGEDDDNAYQESDEALPDDLEEATLHRDPSKEGGRFDEV